MDAKRDGTPVGPSFPTEPTKSTRSSLVHPPNEDDEPRLNRSPLSRISHLARIVDPRLRSNLTALLLAGAAAVAAWAIESPSASPATLVIVASLTFLGWAIGRELDPDRNQTATLASLLTAVGVIGGGLDVGGVLGAAAALMTIRIIAGTPGLPPTRFDLGGLAVMMLVAAAGPGWAATVGVAGALWLDARLPRHPGAPGSMDDVAVRGQEWFAGVMAVIVIATGLAGTADNPWETPRGIAWAFVAAGLAGMAIGGRRVTVSSRADLTDQQLHPVRIRGGRLAAGGVAVAGLIAQGQAGLAAMLPVWAGLISLGIMRLVSSSVPGEEP